jgi:hypothetical protein
VGLQVLVGLEMRARGAGLRGPKGCRGYIQPWYHMWDSHEVYGMAWAVSSG